MLLRLLFFAFESIGFIFQQVIDVICYVKIVNKYFFFPSVLIFKGKYNPCKDSWRYQ